MPILRHELTLIARRQRVTLWRCLFALALAASAAIGYIVAAENAKHGFGKRQVAEVTQYIALALFFLLFTLGVAVAPQWTADAIAGEKERHTLPFLLLTPLTSRTIILSKLLARLAQIALFLLAGLPILCGLQFFGGIAPELILLGSAALAATVVSAASISILASVSAPSTKAASQRAGRVVAFYIIGMMILGQALRQWPQFASLPSPQSPVTLHDLYDWANIGNPIVVGNQIQQSVGAGLALFDVLIPAVRDYVLFHVLVVLGCTTLAIVRLRRTAAEEGDASTPPKPAKSKLKQPLDRPPVSEARPVTWKMLYCDQRLVKTRFNLAFTRLVFLLSFAPLLLTIVLTLYFASADELPQSMNALMRGLVMVAMCGSVFHVLGQASTSVARERIKQTLEDLLLTDLSTTEILCQKWLGAILSMRWFTVWVAIHWTVGVLTYGLHPLALIPLTAIWLANIASAASLGMWCTVRWQTPKTAGVWGGVFVVGLALAPMIVAGVLLATVGLPPNGAPAAFLFVPVMMSSPFALALSAFDLPNLQIITRATAIYMIVGAVLCVLFHVALAWYWWRGACRRFPRSIGRG